MGIAQPIIHKICDDPVSLKEFEENLLSTLNEKSQEIITSFPTVYIHNWKDSGDYEVYIGESNNVFQRTKQHYETGNHDEDSWQSVLEEKSASLYIIGHEHFNKSMTLDVENRLMQYMLSIPKVRKVHNLRGNLQNHYYPMEEVDKEICKLAQKEESSLSRLIATYDWEYNAKSQPETRSSKYWEVLINGWRKPWNRELESELSPMQKRHNKKLAWAEQAQTIKEVGSTFTIISNIHVLEVSYNRIFGRSSEIREQYLELAYFFTSCNLS